MPSNKTLIAPAHVTPTHDIGLLRLVLAGKNEITVCFLGGSRDNLASMGWKSGSGVADFDEVSPSRRKSPNEVRRQFSSAWIGMDRFRSPRCRSSRNAFSAVDIRWPFSHDMPPGCGSEM